MEPAILYLVVVSASAVLWLAGDVVWAIGLWAARRSTRSASRLARIAMIAVGLMLVAASWKIPTASAEVVPPAHRVMVSQDAGAARTTPVLTLRAMVETAGHPSSTYTVRSGDCLWKIARTAIIHDGDVPTGAMITDLWRRIYDINSDVIGANPRLIFPGQVLEIPER